MNISDIEHKIFVYYNKLIPGDWTLENDEENRETIFFYRENNEDKKLVVKWEEFLTQENGSKQEPNNIEPSKEESQKETIKLETQQDDIEELEENLYIETKVISFREMNDLIFDNQLEQIDFEDRVETTFENIKYITYKQRN